MDVIVTCLLNSNGDEFKSENTGFIKNNKIFFEDDYSNIFDIDNLILERESEDIHSLFDYGNNKATYFIKQINNNLDIKIKVTNKIIKDNEITIDYNTYLEEITNCTYTIKWRKL